VALLKGRAPAGFGTDWAGPLVWLVGVAAMLGLLAYFRQRCVRE